MKNYIYGLIDPRTNEVRYVGKTFSIERRVKEHTSEHSLKYRTRKNNWLKELLRAGFSPEVTILEECGEDWEDRERYWITQFPNLTNGTEGGIGSKGHEVSDEVRGTMAERNRKVWTGRKHSEEAKAKMAAAKLGKKLPEEVRKKMSESQSKHTHDYYAKSYEVTTPKGEILQIKNLSKFCRDNSLAYSEMHKYATGKRLTPVKGFTIRPLSEDGSNRLETRV